MLNKRKVEGNRIEFFTEQSDKVERKKGWIQGIPTIQEKLAANGSPRATFETTEDRLTFLIHIPVRAGSEKTTEKKAVSSEEKAISSEEITSSSEKKERVNQTILAAVKKNPKVSAAEIAMLLGLSSRAVEKRIKALRENGILRRIGPDKGGLWEIIEK